MGERGPKPDSARDPISLIPKERPKPFVDMLAEEKRIWNRIVSAFPPDHFGTQHLDLLRTYCESRAEVARYQKRIRKEGETIEGGNGGTKAHPLFGPLSCARANMATLSVKLGITANTNTKNKGEKKTKSSRSELMFNG